MSDGNAKVADEKIEEGEKEKQEIFYLAIMLEKDYIVQNLLIFVKNILVVKLN